MWQAGTKKQHATMGSYLALLAIFAIRMESKDIGLVLPLRHYECGASENSAESLLPGHSE